VQENVRGMKEEEAKLYKVRTKATLPSRSLFAGHDVVHACACCSGFALLELANESQPNSFPKLSSLEHVRCFSVWESLLCCLFDHFVIIVDTQFLCGLPG
jgi:hypothetical protein